MKRIKRIISFVCVITLIISSLVVTNAADESTNTDVKVIGIHKSSTKNNIYIVLDSLPDSDTPGSTTYSGFTVDVVKEATTQENLSVSVTSDGTLDSCIVLSIGDYLTEAVNYELILKGSATDDINNASITLAEDLKIHIDSTGKVYEVMNTNLWPGTNHVSNTHNVVSMQCEDLTSYLPGYATLDGFINSDGEQLGGTYDSAYDTKAEPYYMNGDKEVSLDNTLVSFKIKYSYTNNNVPIFLLGGSKNNVGFGIFPSTSGNTLNIVNYDQKNYPLVDKGEATEQPYSLARVNVTEGYTKGDERACEYAAANVSALGAGAFFKGDKEFLLQLSFEYYDSTPDNGNDTKDKLKLGVYVEGNLMKLEFSDYTTADKEYAVIDEDGKLVMSVYREEDGTHYHGANADFQNMTNGSITLSSVTTTSNLSDWSLQPISGTDNGVFKHLSDGTEEPYSSFEFGLSNSRNWMQLCYSDNEGDAFDDGAIFHIKGVFEVVHRDDNELCYHDIYNKAIHLDERYQWKNEQWNLYEDVTVDGVYKDSKSGIVNLRMSSLPNASDGATPVEAEYSGLTVEIFDGTDTNTYSVSASADTTKNLTVNLSSYMNESKDYEITLKAGTYVSDAANADFSMNIVEDFMFYQDASTGLIYEEIGSTKLIPGENFNLASSGNYLIGADYTDELPDFVYDDERWTIYLKPLNEESGVFRRTLNGEETRLELITDYKLIWPTETKSMYRLWISEDCQEEGDVFTIKGRFQVMNYNAVAAYKNYHMVLDLDKVQYQYKDAKWKWVSDDSIYLTYQEGNVSFESADSETSETKIYAFEADLKSGIFVNDIRKTDAYLTETETGSLCVHLPVTVASGDKITLTGGFLHPTDGTVVTYAETSFWYGEDIVQVGTEETISSGYDDLLGKSKTEADINADGELDVLDIVRMKRWYGEDRVPVKNTEWTDALLGDITHQSSEENMMSALCDRILEMGDYMDVMPISAGQGPVYRKGTAADAEAALGTETNYITDYYFQLIAEAGINTIKSADMDYNGTSTEKDMVKKNLEMSAKYGLGYYVRDSKITSYAGSTEEINTTELAARLAEYSYYPAYRGVNIVDEPNSPTYNNNDDETQNKYISKYGNLMDALNTIDANSLSGILPWYTSMGEEQKTVYQSYVEEYCDTFNPKLLGYNHYPFTKDTAQGASEPELDIYFWNMSVIRECAEAYHIPFGGVVQAGGHWNDDSDADDRNLLPVIDAFPTEGQFRWNVNTYLAFGAKSISYFPLIQPWHFAYAQDDSGNETRDYRRNGLIGADGKTNVWYDYAKEMNQHIAVIDEVLMNSENEGLLLNATEGGTRANSIFSTYEVTNFLSDFVEVNSDYIINEGIDTQYSVTGSFLSYSEKSSEGEKAAWREVEDVTGNAVVGCFDFQGKTALYIVNYDMESTATITLDFDGAQRMKKVQQAKTSYETTEILELSMEAGEGVLLVIQ